MTDSADPKPFPVVTIPPGEAADCRRVVDYLLRQLVQQGSLDAATAADCARRIQHRERLGSTAIGGGLAIPHGQVEGMVSTAGVIGDSEVGVSWPGSADGQPVHRVCLIVTPAGPGAVPPALEQLVRQLRKEIA